MVSNAIVLILAILTLETLAVPLNLELSINGVRNGNRAKQAKTSCIPKDPGIRPEFGPESRSFEKNQFFQEEQRNNLCNNKPGFYPFFNSALRFESGFRDLCISHSLAETSTLRHHILFQQKVGLFHVSTKVHDSNRKNQFF